MYNLVSTSQAIIFCNTIKKIDLLEQNLKQNNFSITVIHSNMSMDERNNVINNFREGLSRVLLTTDLLARGIDIPQVNMVINYDLPQSKETYVHRIGRTGRAGNGGIAISFCGKDEHPYWKDIMKLIKVDVKTVSEHPYPWHSGSPETAPATTKNNSNRSGEANKSRKSSNSKQNKKRWY